MAAPFGNKNNTKLKTPELKKEAYRQYCAWVALGNFKKAWCFDHPDIQLTYKSIQNYMRDDPVNFPPSQLEVADAKNLAIWIERGIEMMMSQERCQPAIYQMMMRNIHGWDKDTPEEKEAKARDQRNTLKELLTALKQEQQNAIIEKTNPISQ
jgi:hypothetical protein